MLKCVRTKVIITTVPLYNCTDHQYYLYTDCHGYSHTNYTPKRQPLVTIQAYSEFTISLLTSTHFEYVTTASSSRYPTNLWQNLGLNKYATLNIVTNVPEKYKDMVKYRHRDLNIELQSG